METRAPGILETNIDGVGDDSHDYLTIKFPVIDDENVSCTVPLAIDITEQKRTEFELRKSKETAELANRAETEFLAEISNELRTPLNLIIGFSDVLQTAAFGPISEKYREYASDINRSGGHLLALISGILNVSKVEAGEIEIDEEKLDLHQLIYESI